MIDLSEDDRLPKILAQLEPGANFIVGGYVRDKLLGRQANDIDLSISKDISNTADRLAKALNGHVFMINEAHQFMRVLVADAGYQIDLSPLDVEIEQDLGRRDFTITAIAFELQPGSELSMIKVVDPYGGADDLKKGILRTVSESALDDDPIRILRAVRFACKFGLKLTPELERNIRRTASRLSTGPSERILEELCRMANENGFADALRLMEHLSVLSALLPECQDLVGVGQNQWHHLDVWGHTLMTIEQLELFFRNPKDFWPEHAPWLMSEMDHAGQSSCRHFGELKLAALFHDIGKPKMAETGDDGVIRFHGHPVVGAQIFGAVATRLKLSKQLRSMISIIIKEHMRPGFYAKDAIVEPRTIERFFRLAGPWVPDIVLISAADRLAARGRLATDDIIASHLDYLGLLLREYQAYVRKPTPIPIINGRELIDRLGLKEGPLIGKLLRQIERAVAEGRVSSPEEAIELAKKITSDE